MMDEVTNIDEISNKKLMMITVILLMLTLNDE